MRNTSELTGRGITHTAVMAQCNKTLSHALREKISFEEQFASNLPQ